MPTHQPVSATALNSLTKYPSIPTYHILKKDGGLTEPGIEFTGPVIATEKIDGVNIRVIMMPTGRWIVGSREELLHAEGDYLSHGSQGIVDHLRPFLNDWTWNLNHTDHIHVLYAEFYGRKLTPAGTDYTGTGQLGLRLFDFASIPNYREIAQQTPEQIARWRESGGQEFYSEEHLAWVAKEADLDLTPRLGTFDAYEIPCDVENTHIWLQALLPATQAALDDTARSNAEGIVLRTPDRATIAKLRFQNYRRAAKLSALGIT